MDGFCVDGYSKPGREPILLVYVSVLFQEPVLFEPPPVQDVGNSEQSEGKTDDRSMIYAPANDPQDEARVHRMPDFGKQSGRDEMIDVLNTSELNECPDSDDHADAKKSKAEPSYGLRQIDLKRVRGAKRKPRNPEGAHHGEDNRENGLALRVDLTPFE
jgi:hypothetical protein